MRYPFNIYTKLAISIKFIGNSRESFEYESKETLIVTLFRIPDLTKFFQIFNYAERRTDHFKINWSILQSKYVEI